MTTMPTLSSCKSRAMPATPELNSTNSLAATSASPVASATPSYTADTVPTLRDATW